MPKILLSYRRSDSGGIAGRIFDRLVGHYGTDSIFMDVDNIPFGADFREHIQESLLTSDLLLAIVGPRWLGALPDGHLRIKDDNDPVRVEVETALQQRLPVIPILVDGAVMPSPADLPETLTKFSYLNAPSVDIGRDFHQHMDRVIRAIDGIMAAKASARAAEQAAALPAAAATMMPPPAETSRRSPQMTSVGSALPRARMPGKWLLAGGGAVAIAGLLALTYLQWRQSPPPGGTLAAVQPGIGSPVVTPGAAPAPPPIGATIRIGTSTSLTGPLSANKSAALAQKIWQDDINAKGGMLGRRVELVSYDDEGTPATVPGIYTKLLDVDKVDLIVGGYGTTIGLSVMPIAMQRNKVLVGLLAVDINNDFKYQRYFAMTPTGSDPKATWSRGFFNLAMAQNPKPRSWGILAADAAFCKERSVGAHDNAKAAGLALLYDRTFPLSKADFAAEIAALRTANPDIVFVCSSAGSESVAIVRQIGEAGLAPRMIGGSMNGLQVTNNKVRLGALLNGWVIDDFWLPAPALEFAGTKDFIRKYQAKATAEVTDPLGHNIAPWAYAQLQVLGEAIEATKSIDDNTLADYIRANTVKTVVGDVKFGTKGEWAESRILQVQFQNIKGGSLDQFRDTKTQVVVDPPGYKSGNLIYPFADARR